jgi:hypothetical protein
VRVRLQWGRRLLLLVRLRALGFGHMHKVRSHHLDINAHKTQRHDLRPRHVAFFFCAMP